jgi:hypothetical protein
MERSRVTTFTGTTKNLCTRSSPSVGRGEADFFPTLRFLTHQGACVAVDSDISFSRQQFVTGMLLEVHVALCCWIALIETKWLQSVLGCCQIHLPSG